MPRCLVVAIAAAGLSEADGATAQISFATTVVSSSAGLANFAGTLSGDGVWDLTWIFWGSCAVGSLENIGRGQMEAKVDESIELAYTIALEASLPRAAGSSCS